MVSIYLIMSSIYLLLFIKNPLLVFSQILGQQLVEVEPNLSHTSNDVTSWFRYFKWNLIQCEIHSSFEAYTRFISINSWSENYQVLSLVIMYLLQNYGSNLFILLFFSALISLYGFLRLEVSVVIVIRSIIVELVITACFTNWGADGIELLSINRYIG